MKENDPLTMDDSIQRLLAAIENACPMRRTEWLKNALTQLRRSDNLLDDTTLLFARAQRELGHAVLGNSDSEIKIGDAVIRDWPCGEAGRIALLLTAIHRESNSAVQVVRHIYDMGDDTEKAAVIRGMQLYGAGQAIKDIALSAGRTNNIVLFSALAVNNPYPAAQYTDHEFNQLVLKALFMGVNIALVSGLKERANPRLSQMCEDYHDERTAAGRGTPQDIWLALGPFASNRGKALALNCLTDGDPIIRYYAATGLSWNRSLNAQDKSFIAEFASKEPNQRVRDALMNIVQS